MECSQSNTGIIKSGMLNITDLIFQNLMLKVAFDGSGLSLTNILLDTGFQIFIHLVFKRDERKY